MAATSNEASLSSWRFQGWQLLFILTLLYMFTVGIRLYGVTAAGIQSDEQLWIARGYGVYKKAGTDWRHLTSDLPHPGIPSSTLIALGHKFREEVRERWIDQSNPVDPVPMLDVSRVFIILVVSLLVPLIFLFGRNYFSETTALLGAAWFALDPRITGFSRLAHIDAMLALTCFLTFHFYISGVRKGELWRKLLAGIFWALSLASKPPALIVLFILLCYRVWLWAYEKYVERQGQPRFFLDWSDFWTLLVGQVTFVLIFTRLWDVKSAYISRLHVNPELAAFVYRFARLFHRHALVSTAGSILLFSVALAAFWIWRKTRSQISWHLLNFCSFVGFCFSIFWMFPVLQKNLALYWSWVGGLSSTKHIAFGKIIPDEAKLGYLNIIFTELPLLSLCAAVMGLSFYILTLWRNRRKLNEVQKYATACMLYLIIWVLIMNLSSKQGLRYLLPVLPFFYLLAALGVEQSVRLISGKISPAKVRPLAVGTYVVVLLYAMGLFLCWQPYQFIFYNSLIGGLPGAIQRERGYLFAGQYEAVDILHQKVVEGGEHLFVSVIGDLKVLQSAYARRWPETKQQISFAAYAPEVADYLLVFSSHISYLDRERWSETLKQNQKDSVIFQGAPIVEIYSVAPRDLKTGSSIYLKDAYKHTGKIISNAGAVRIAAQIGLHKPGYIYFTDGVKVLPGNYSLQVEFITSDPLTDKQILRLELSSCSKNFSRGDLKIGSKQQATESYEIELTCPVDTARRLIPRIFWTGQQNLEVSRVIIKAINPAASVALSN